jgi:hypothetical protein
MVLASNPYICVARQNGELWQSILIEACFAFGQCSALAARTAGGFCAENMMYQIDAIENRVGRNVQSRLHKFADGDFHFSDRTFPDRILVESY